MSISFPAERPLASPSIKERSCVSHDLPWRKPCCELVRILCNSKWFTKALAIICSFSLQQMEMKNTAGSCCAAPINLLENWCDICKSLLASHCRCVQAGLKDLPEMISNNVKSFQYFLVGNWVGPHALFGWRFSNTFLTPTVVTFI